MFRKELKLVGRPSPWSALGLLAPDQWLPRTSRGPAADEVGHGRRGARLVHRRYGGLERAPEHEAAQARRHADAGQALRQAQCERRGAGSMQRRARPGR